MKQAQLPQVLPLILEEAAEEMVTVILDQLMTKQVQQLLQLN
jgi:hypothetical protein